MVLLASRGRGEVLPKVLAEIRLGRGQILGEFCFSSWADCHVINHVQAFNGEWIVFSLGIVQPRLLHGKVQELLTYFTI